MEFCGLPLLLLIVLIVLLLVGAGAVVVLLKLGVIAQYWSKDEPPEGGDYSLDQSQSVDED